MSDSSVVDESRLEVDPVGALVQRPDVSGYPLDDELVLYDERTGQVFVLNRVGAQVWSLLDGSRTPHAISEELSRSYPIEYGQVRADVDELLSDLARAGLVQPSDQAG